MSAESEQIVRDNPNAELMLGFESLGERCDFGAVQRYYGVEPLGLLRFCLVRFEGLLAGLDANFDVVGSAEDTGFEDYEDENLIRMKRYNLVFHTFIYNRDLPTPEKRGAFQEQQLRRLVFLKNKLIGDLKEAKRVFVYGRQEETISDADAIRLWAAVRRYGRNRLLCTRPASDSCPAGTVIAMEDGLFVGYVERFADFVAGEYPPFQSWRTVCETVQKLSRPGRHQRAIDERT